MSVSSRTELAEDHPIHAPWRHALTRLSALMPGYEPRPGQVVMMQAVAQAHHEGEDLVVEAGTGTGKTLAYLLPLVAAGKRMVLSTATRQLQEQLVQHDLPTALEATGSSQEVALLKGRRNYLCIERSNAAIAKERQLVGLISPELQAIQRALMHTHRGDINQVQGVEDSHPIWSEVTSTADNCLGQECPSYQQCFVVQARREAQKADIVVINHHLLFADYAIKEKSDGQGLLPAVDAIVIDEAHAIEDVATRFFGRSVSSSRFEAMRREVSDVVSGLSVPDEQVDPLFSLIRQASQASKAMFALAEQWSGQPRLDAAKLSQLLSPSQRLIKVCLDLSAALSSVDSDDVDAVRVLAASIRQFAADTEAVLALPSDEQDLSVRWVEIRARSVALVARPLEVGPILERTLLAESASRLFTSATVAIGDDFRSFIDSLGLAESTQTLRVPGTFDYPSQALLYVPTHLPEPFAPGRDHALTTEIVRLIQASEGGAFALFSSYRAMRSSYYRAVDSLTGYQVLMQGQESRERLIERFRAEQPAVLFATMGFWQGVDLPGQVLRMVILDKVPFPPPDDPLFAARSDRLKAAGESSFARLSIPSAAISLRQGFGRLIRSKADRGVVSILDPRIRRRSYGRTLLNALPPATQTDRFEDVAAFYSDICDR